MKSGMYTLQTMDFLKGLVIAVGTAVLVVVQNSIQNGELTFNWKLIATAAVGAGITYVLKNLLTDDTAAAVRKVESAGGTVINK